LLTLLGIVIGVLVVALGVGVVGGVLRSRDVRRRDAERREYENRKADGRDARARLAVGQIAARYFPFVHAELEGHREGEPSETLRRLLQATPGIRLGQADVGYPAILPLAERRRHLMVLGKSGYGKTTLALRLLRDDLEAGRGVCVLGSEAELFRDWVLPLIPVTRASQTIYFRPADPRCTVTWNPLALEDGDDRALAAGELFSIFKRAVGEDSIGARADAILSSAFALLIGRPGATLWSVARLLEDDAFRASVVEDIDDPYLREFWTKTFPEYPDGAVLPLANRLNSFLRVPAIRAALCHPVSSFSFRGGLAQDGVLGFDVSGLDPATARLIGQAVLSKFQLELMRRERIPEQERNPIHLYVDEFHVFASTAEGTWRELLARGRRYGLGLHLFTQHPNQLPRSLQQEILGNVSSIVALNLSANDAAAVRRELMAPVAGGGIKPVATEDFIGFGIGEGFARLSAGSCALKVRFEEPIAKPDAAAGDRIRDISWKTYAAPPLPSPPQPVLPKTPDAGSATGAAPASIDPGRGGAKHKLLQKLIKDWGQARGFRATVEDEILGGAGRVDVSLVRGDVRIGVEVAVTSTADQTADSITKALAAGFTTLVVVSPDAATLKSAQDQVRERLEAQDQARVRFFDAHGLRSFIETLPNPEADGESAAGYTLKIETEPVSRSSSESRRRSVARLVGSAKLRQRWPS
jgi:hypothetical protein